MPERQASVDTLRGGAVAAGWLLTLWLLVLAALSFTTPTVVGDALHAFGAPQWMMPAALLAIAALQICGHIIRSAPVMVKADLGGATACMTAATISVYAAAQGDNASISAANWVLIGCLFLIHAAILKRT